MKNFNKRNYEDSSSTTKHICYNSNKYIITSLYNKDNQKIPNEFTGINFYGTDVQKLLERKKINELICINFIIDLLINNADCTNLFIKIENANRIYIKTRFNNYLIIEEIVYSLEYIELLFLDNSDIYHKYPNELIISIKDNNNNIVIFKIYLLGLDYANKSQTHSYNILSCFQVNILVNYNLTKIPEIVNRLYRIKINQL